MKKKIAVGILACGLLCGCSQDPYKIDKQFVKLEDGRVLRVHRGTGDLYFFDEPDLEKLTSDIDRIKNISEK